MKLINMENSVMIRKWQVWEAEQMFMALVDRVEMKGGLTEAKKQRHKP